MMKSAQAALPRLRISSLVAPTLAEGDIGADGVAE